MNDNFETQEILVMIKFSVFIKELIGVINDCNFGRSIHYDIIL